MKKLLYFLIALIVILVAGYFIMMNLPKASSAKKDAAHTFEATTLMGEFTRNEERANRKYVGKIIEVTGTVTEIEKDKNGATVVYLKAGEGFESVLCTLEKGSTDVSQSNQSVRIKGQCNGYLGGAVNLNKCILVE